MIYPHIAGSTIISVRVPQCVGEITDNLRERTFYIIIATTLLVPALTPAFASTGSEESSVFDAITIVWIAVIGGLLLIIVLKVISKFAGKGIPRKARKALKRLDKYEIPSGVAERLKRKFPFNRMSDQEVKTCIDEFKKFIAILIIGRSKKKRVAMTSEIIDEVWHTFMLFTQEYHKFSKMLIGDYIHHTPNTGDARFGPDAVKYFYENYQKYFGDLHPVWKLKLLETNLAYDANTNTVTIVETKPVSSKYLKEYAASPIRNYYDRFERHFEEPLVRILGDSKNRDNLMSVVKYELGENEVVGGSCGSTGVGCGTSCGGGCGGGAGASSDSGGGGDGGGASCGSGGGCGGGGGGCG